MPIQARHREDKSGKRSLRDEAVTDTLREVFLGQRDAFPRNLGLRSRLDAQANASTLSVPV
jgi:hypothetical protein